MTPKKYRLEFGYMHCIGRTVYTAGTADTEEKARAWVYDQSIDNSDGPVIPTDDPIRWCPVRHCHMKRQKPWFAYSEKVSEDS
ncbi:MAG: hypothetical protein GY697_05320 [Desulfobacterales bacterium]|nr:hypothetical protein [Desulfobacterales bacterium]